MAGVMEKMKKRNDLGQGVRGRRRREKRYNKYTCTWTRRGEGRMKRGGKEREGGGEEWRGRSMQERVEREQV